MKHAKPGTFDESEFTDSATGRFKFPAYRHRPDFLVRITDETDYRGDIWNNLGPDEKRNFALIDFENEFFGPDLAVDDFEMFFGKARNPYLGELGALRGDFSVVQELIDAMNDNEMCCVDEKTEKILTKGGYVFVHEPVNASDMAKHFMAFTVSTLKNAAKTKGLSLSGNKQDIIRNMVDSGRIFDLPRACFPAPSFFDWLEQVAEGYIVEIHKNARRFHPLYHEHIWLSADSVGVDVVDLKIQKVLASQYWLSMLE